MKRRVKITRMPDLKSGAEIKLEGLRAGLGFNANVMPWPIMAGKMSEPDYQVNSTLNPVPRDEANLEAEKGEVAMVPGSGGIPDVYKIGGKRHYEGGTPLNLPDDSFIFSDTAKMRIKDPSILAQFGMSQKKGGHTPADIAKRYDVNTYKKILLDPNTDDLQRDTAEKMIANYNLKLAKLSLVQESMKGFPQGIPAISLPYIEEMGMDPAEFAQVTPSGGDDETSEADNMTAAYGGILQQLKARKQGGMFDQYQMAYGGLPKAQTGFFGNALNYASEVLSAPQKAAVWAITGALTGKPQYATPSEAMNIENPYLAFGTDLLLDPLNVVALGPEALAKLATTGFKAGTRKAAQVGARAAGKDAATNIGKKAAQLATEHSTVVKKAKLAGSKGFEEAKSLTGLKDEAKNILNKKAASQKQVVRSTAEATKKGAELEAAKMAQAKQTSRLERLKAKGATEEEINIAKEKVKEATETLNSLSAEHKTILQTVAGHSDETTKLAKEHYNTVKKINSITANLDEAGKILSAPVGDKVNQILLRAGLPSTAENIKAAEAALAAAEKHAAKASATSVGTSMKAASAARKAAAPVTEATELLTEVGARLQKPMYKYPTIAQLIVPPVNQMVNPSPVVSSALDARADQNIEASGEAKPKSSTLVKKFVVPTGYVNIQGSQYPNYHLIKSKTDDTFLYVDDRTGKMAVAVDKGRMLTPYDAFNRSSSSGTTTEEDQETYIENTPEQPITVQPSTSSRSTDSGDDEVEVIKRYGGPIDDYFADGGEKKIKRYQYSQSEDRIRPVYEDDTIGDFEDIENELPEDKYNELVKLYEEAEKEAAGNPNKYSPKTEAFQKKYHEYLPNRARKIISADPQKTTRGVDKGFKKFDLNSNQDGMFGRRTKQYLADLNKIKAIKAEQKGAAKTETATTTQPQGDYVDRVEATHLDNLQKANTNVPWWLQDIIGTANAASDYATVQQYNPWQATTPVYGYEPTYYDPARELAAVAEQTNIGAQALSQFVGPQQFNARFSEMAGQGAKQAADILGRYNSLNVGIANKVAQDNANLMNQAAALRAAEQTGLYDKYTIAKQQFDNSKRQAKNKMVSQYIQGITNRANTQALNALYPQFAVDPSTGGMMVFHDPRSLKPSSGSRKTYQDYVREAVEANPQLEKASPADINNAVKILMMIDAGKTPEDAFSQYKTDKRTVQGYPGTASASEEDEG